MPEKFYSRPMDRSLEAYKAWISAIVQRLNPQAADTMTEAEWIKSWEKFWAKVDGNSDTQQEAETQ